MTEMREAIKNALWGKQEPFPKTPPVECDFQGWNSDHPYLTLAIEQLRPRLCVEVGVWKGKSIITMAEAMKRCGIDGAIIAVDTWLGWWEDWPLLDLHMQDGYPTLYRTFQANIISKGLTDYVVPLPLDSVNASAVVKDRGIDAVCVVHIDGSHDYESVMRDLGLWWPVLAEGGVLIGDDYCDEGGPWPGVKRAFDRFFAGVRPVQHSDWKCVVRK